MLKFIAFFILTLALAGCAIGGDKWDRFTFNVQNNCSHTVTVGYEGLGQKRQNHEVAPHSTFTNGGGSRRPPNATYDDAEKKYLNFGHKIHIAYPDGHEETMTFQEFTAKAEAQMGRKGRGEWTLILCPVGK